MAVMKQPGGRLEPEAFSASLANGNECPVRMGVVGLGYWGPNLVRVLHESAVAEAGWMCDLRPEALDSLGQRFPAVRQTQDFPDAAPERAQTDRAAGED